MSSGERVLKCKTVTGREVSFYERAGANGSIKNIHFSPDGGYVVGFYQKPQPLVSRERLTSITTSYADGIFNNEGGSYWREVFCWPEEIIQHPQFGLGIVVPTYDSQYFFEYGSKDNDFMGLKGREKEGKWFASANLRRMYFDRKELGNWLTHLQMCLRIARGVRRLHIAGLAHSDLSYKNVLVNPARGTACIIDIDGLVVPGKFPPDVVGTPDFIAPEVVRTAELPLSDPNKNLPRRQTDEHALAVLIYMYLLYRHPLRGGRLLHQDPGIEESLMMGEKALFVEHPTDPSNRINVEERKPTELPWVDTNKMPYKIVGPYLGKLFERAFIDGLHDPSKRPSANDWEIALVETMDLLQPCKNPDCEEGWYVFDNSTAPRCPFCGTPYQGKLPVLNLYSSRDGKDFRSDNVRLMVWTGQSLFEWHTNRLVLPNEKLCGEQLKRVGYFVFHQERWWLVNERLPNMVDYTESQGGRSIPVGGKVELREGAKVLMSSANGGRLFQVQMVNG
jgi:hypothetical protein